MPARGRANLVNTRTVLVTAAGNLVLEANPRRRAVLFAMDWQGTMTLTAKSPPLNYLAGINLPNYRPWIRLSGPEWAGAVQSDWYAQVTGSSQQLYIVETLEP